MIADISIIGVKPKNIGFGDKLSPEIEKKIPEIISLIKKKSVYNLFLINDIIWQFVGCNYIVTKKTKLLVTTL